MRRRAIIAVVLSWGLAGPVAAAPACDLTSLAMDGVVVRYDVATQQAPRDVPLLEIDADRTVRWRDGDAVQTGKLSEDDFAMVMQRITGAGGFAAIDPAALPAVVPAGQPLRALADGSLPVVVADAPTSYLQVTGVTCSHDVSVYGLAAAASVYDDNAAIQTLRGIEQELLALHRRLRG